MDITNGNAAERVGMWLDQVRSTAAVVPAQPLLVPAQRLLCACLCLLQGDLCLLNG